MDTVGRNCSRETGSHLPGEEGAHPFETRKLPQFTTAAQRSLTWTTCIHSIHSSDIVKIYFNIIPLLGPTSYKWPFPFGFCEWSCLYFFLLHADYISRRRRISWYIHPDNISWKNINVEISRVFFEILLLFPWFTVKGFKETYFIIVSFEVCLEFA